MAESLVNKAKRVLYARGYLRARNGLYLDLYLPLSVSLVAPVSHTFLHTRTQHAGPENARTLLNYTLGIMRKAAMYYVAPGVRDSVLCVMIVHCFVLLIDCLLFIPRLCVLLCV